MSDRRVEGATPPRPAEGLSAVVIDRLGLVRAGVRETLLAAGVSRVIEDRTAAAAIDKAVGEDVGLAVVGDPDDIDVSAAAQRAKAMVGNPRVVVLAPDVDLQSLLELLESGCDGVLPRTADDTELTDAVSAVLAGKRVLPPTLSRGFAAQRLAGGGASPDRGAEVGLSRRETQVLERLALGESNDEIAGALFISRATVKTHLARIYDKLGASDRHDAVARAAGLRLFD